MANAAAIDSANGTMITEKCQDGFDYHHIASNYYGLSIPSEILCKRYAGRFCQGMSE